MDFEDLVPKANQKKKVTSQAYNDFEDLIPQAKPSVGVSDEIAPYFTKDPLPAPPFEDQALQGWAPNPEAFVKYLTDKGYKILPQEGRGVVLQDDKGNVFDTGQTDWLTKNYPDVLLTLGAAIATGGGSLPSMAAKSGLKGFGGMISKLLARGALEGSANLGAEGIRQGVGLGLGVGDDLDLERIIQAGQAGFTAPLVSKGISGTGGLLKKGQQSLSNVPNEISDIVRKNPQIMDMLNKDKLEADQLGFTKRLAEEGSGVISRSAKEKGESLASSEVAIEPQSIFKMLQGSEEAVTRPFGSKSILDSAKSDLESRFGRTRQLNLFDSRGKNIVVDIPDEVVTPQEIAAFKSQMQSISNYNPLDPSDYREKLTGFAAKGARAAEDDVLDLEGKIARDRLAAANRLQESYPSLKKGISANEEDQLKDLLFRPSREDAMQKSLSEFDPLAADFEIAPFSREYSDLMARKKVSAQNRLFPYNTGASNILPGAMAVAGSALGVPTAGASYLGTVIGQSPATTLRINQLLGYLDRLAAKGGGKVGTGANALREAALMEMMEND